MALQKCMHIMQITCVYMAIQIYLFKSLCVYMAFQKCLCILCKSHVYNHMALQIYLCKSLCVYMALQKCLCILCKSHVYMALKMYLCIFMQITQIKHHFNDKSLILSIIINLNLN